MLNTGLFISKKVENNAHQLKKYIKWSIVHEIGLL